MLSFNAVRMRLPLFCYNCQNSPRIQVMETTINCPTCSDTMPAEAEICPACGQAFCPACLEPIDPNDETCAWCEADLTLMCPGCGRMVRPDAILCSKCGLLLREVDSTIVPEYTRFRTDATDDGEEAFTGTCPTCESPLYLEDGFCHECGQGICGNCGHPVDEDDEVCSECSFQLYFECPLCSFELTTGTEICPNCNALFPAFCPGCGTSLLPEAESCPECRRQVVVKNRASARTIRSFIVGQNLVRMVSCPDCGKNFDPAVGPCPSCDSIVCGACQLNLENGERYCPRCGRAAVNGLAGPER